MEQAAAEHAEVLPICARMEAEIADMDSEEKALFLSELGLENSGLDRLIQASYRLLGLISYLTAGAPEVRAWTITKGTRRRRRRGKSTPISSGDSSGPRSSPMMTSSPAVRWPRPRKRAWSGRKARST